MQSGPLIHALIGFRERARQLLLLHQEQEEGEVGRNGMRVLDEIMKLERDWWGSPVVAYWFGPLHPRIRRITWSSDLGNMGLYGSNIHGRIEDQFDGGVQMGEKEVYQQIVRGNIARIDTKERAEIVRRICFVGLWDE